MKFRTLFCLFAMLALAPVVFAQERAPGRDPSPPQNGSERQLPGSDIEVKTSTHEDVKTTESQIKDLKKRLEKLEKEFKKIAEAIEAFVKDGRQRMMSEYN